LCILRSFVSSWRILNFPSTRSQHSNEEISAAAPRAPVNLRTAALFVALVLAGISGCAKTARVAPATQISQEEFAQTYDATVNAWVAPPAGWTLDPYKKSSMHSHAVWISPSGRTAYGVISFSLPLPVGHDLVLWGFLNEMRRTEGEATLLSKQWDDKLPGLRFVAQGGRYVVRTNLTVRGFHGWACYAGTLRSESINADELAEAEKARERTTFGKSGR